MLVPAPYDDYTTSRVLTMEFVDGRKVTPDNRLALLGKTLLNLDAVATCLDPGFESLPTMQRHIPDLMRTQMSATSGSALGSLMEAREFVEELPGR